MKKLAVGVAIVAALAAAIFLLWPRTPEAEMVFDMRYRGLSGRPDELRYNAYWGYGGQEQETPSPFLKDVKKTVERLHAVYNPEFRRAQWSAIEIKGNNAVALYFDLNADEAFSANERILPFNKEEAGGMKRTEFVTPDFIVHTNDGRQVPFRALLQVAFYDQSSFPNCMWSPSCVLEGTSVVHGKPTRLILFAGGFSGSFKDFGRASYALVTKSQKVGQYLPRETLSSLINYNGKFYSLKLEGDHGKGQSVRAVLEDYTGATGELAVQLTGNANLRAELSSASITGCKDTTIRFNVPSGQAEIPTGAFTLNSGYISYGAEADDQWRVSFSEDPEFEMAAQKICTLELGKPVLSVWAVEEAKRYQSDVKEQSVYAKGTDIYLQTKIRGKAGELYSRFSHGTGGGQQNDVEPAIRITDSNGKEVVSARMEYGRGGTCEYSWRSPDVRPGRYAVTMTQDTGPLAGIIEGTLDITIQ